MTASLLLCAEGLGFKKVASTSNIRRSANIQHPTSREEPKANIPPSKKRQAHVTRFSSRADQLDVEVWCFSGCWCKEFGAFWLTNGPHSWKNTRRSRPAFSLVEGM